MSIESRVQKISAASKRAGEHNDCVVKAISLAARMPYREALNVCSSAGRKPRGGCSTKLATEVLEARGYKVEEHSPLQKSGSRYTPVTIGEFCKRGYWIARVSGHAFPIVNGVVYDWTAGRRHRIETVWKITKPRISK